VSVGFGLVRLYFNEKARQATKRTTCGLFMYAVVRR